jgi:hypothetical protein
MVSRRVNSRRAPRSAASDLWGWKWQRFAMHRVDRPRSAKIAKLLRCGNAACLHGYRIGARRKEPAAGGSQEACRRAFFTSSGADFGSSTESKRPMQARDPRQATRSPPASDQVSVLNGGFAEHTFTRQTLNEILCNAGRASCSPRSAIPGIKCIVGPAAP